MRISKLLTRAIFLELKVQRVFNNPSLSEYKTRQHLRCHQGYFRHSTPNPSPNSVSYINLRFAIKSQSPKIPSAKYNTYPIAEKEIRKISYFFFFSRENARKSGRKISIPFFFFLFIIYL